ncbi:MAG TPA: molybdenum cofactor guanylyltransferase, partial [Draconibacterium sp.]|nr:molybdenum cofactor guanylyltransferase [Draconibacterium sp.]
MQITGIILSGGQSTRMGTDKALLQIKGKTLLERAVEICNPVCNAILISSNNPEHEKYGYQIYPDEIKNCGPLGGIYSCLKKSDTDWNFILSVDAA